MQKQECNEDEGPKDVDIEKSPLSNVPSSSDDVNKGIKNSVELVSSSSSSSSSSVPASASKHSAATATAAVPPVIELDLAHMRESVSVIGRKDSTTFQFDLHVETEDEDVKADTKKYPKKESEKADKHPTDRKSRKRE